jgi:hypothetical protein
VRVGDGARARRFLGVRANTPGLRLIRIIRCRSRKSSRMLSLARRCSTGVDGQESAFDGEQYFPWASLRDLGHIMLFELLKSTTLLSC